MRFAKETVLGVYEEVMPLLSAHYEELAHRRESMPLDPDWGQYVALEERGAMHVFTARAQGVLVGYSAFFLNPHLHHQNTVVAMNDVLYLTPEMRSGLNGSRFIDYCEQQMRGMGAHRIVWRIPAKHDWSALMYRKGYEDEEKVVTKVLGE